MLFATNPLDFKAEFIFVISPSVNPIVLNAIVNMNIKFIGALIFNMELIISFSELIAIKNVPASTTTIHLDAARSISDKVLFEKNVPQGNVNIISP